MSEYHKVTQEELRTHFTKEDAYFHKLEEERKAASLLKAKSRKCPVDGTEMKETNLHGVLVDRCDECHGIWFDQHEVEALAHALSPKGTPPSGYLSSFLDAIMPKKKS